MKLNDVYEALNKNNLADIVDETKRLVEQGILTQPIRSNILEGLYFVKESSIEDANNYIARYGSNIFSRHILTIRHARNTKEQEQGTHVIEFQPRPEDKRKNIKYIYGDIPNFQVSF